MLLRGSRIFQFCIDIYKKQTLQTLDIFIIAHLFNFHGLHRGYIYALVQKIDDITRKQLK